jgi:hypothetical protein
MKSIRTSLVKGHLFLTPVLLMAFLVFGQVTAYASATVTFGDNSGDDFSGTVEDAMIASPTVNNNYGGRANFTVGNAGATYQYRRSLIRFKDIASNIGTGQSITSATMYLYCENEFSTIDYTVSAYRVLLNWVEGSSNDAIETGACCWDYAQYTGLPWNTAGCEANDDVTGEDSTKDRRSTAEDGTAITGTGTWFTWDLTEAVKNWYSGDWSEYGVVLINSGEGISNSRKVFTSSEGTDGRRPYLEVTYEDLPHYAWWNSPSPTSPYTSWNTASHTIQAAIDAASTTGDTVTVRDGTYNENITMKNGVDVLKETPGNVPDIVGDGTDAVVSFDGAFSNGCTLDGFDISGGGTYPGIYFHGTGAGIDNSTTIENCLVHGNSGPGIELDGTTATTAPIIDNNDIYLNSQEGIYIIDAGSASEDAVIQNNTIRENTLAGINIGGDSYITIGDNNDIYSNYAGIAFDTGDPSTKPITIIGNSIYSNTTESGIVIKDAVSNTETIAITQNDINQNDCGGIQIRNSCMLDITKNKIRDNVRGGIHTGTDVASGGGFPASMGDAILTIRQNKVYENGASNYGGGIDVRHASGTIENNLVYKSHRGAIRFGWENETDPHITAIRNNTVVCPGEDGYGGGIVYDDLAGAVNDQPDGALPGQLVIRNNISAYNETAGLRVGSMPTGNTACPNNDDYDSGKYRDYNLLYSNNGTGATDCGWLTGSYIRSCVNQNYGGCGLTDTWPWEMVNPNDIMADPKFVNMGSDDYHLQNDSLAKNAGDDGEDMGAYGGTYPIHNLIDVDTDTGNTPAGGTYIMFDLGTSYTITDVRLYGTNAYSARSWEVFVGSDTTNCTGTWGTSGGSWSVGGGTGWYPHTLSSSLTGRYIKLVSTGAVSVNEVFEFQYKETTNSYWRSPSLVEKDCTDING